MLIAILAVNVVVLLVVLLVVLHSNIRSGRALRKADDLERAARSCGLPGFPPLVPAMRPATQSEIEAAFAAAKKHSPLPSNMDDNGL